MIAELIHSMAILRQGFSFYGEIAERPSEGQDLYSEMVEAGVIGLNEEDGSLTEESLAAIVYAQQGDSPAARARVGLTALAMAQDIFAIKMAVRTLFSCGPIST